MASIIGSYFGNEYYYNGVGDFFQGITYNSGNKNKKAKVGKALMLGFTYFKISMKFN
jgi:hypothetical protein